MISKKIKAIFLVYYKTGMSFLFFILAIFLMVSFYTCNPDDPSWFHYSDSHLTIHNMFGSFGANITALCFYFWGIASYFLIPFLLYSAYLLIRQRSFLLYIERLLVLSALPFLLSAFFSDGVFGIGLRMIFVKWFDVLGAAVFLYVLIAISIILLFRTSVTIALKGVYRVGCFVSNKQKFLIPAYSGMKICLYYMIVPFLYTYTFCKKLLSGDDVVGENRSIVSFENYVFEPIDESPVEQVEFNFQDDTSSETYGMGKKTESTESSEERVYKLPHTHLFEYREDSKGEAAMMSEFEARAHILEEKLEHFGVFGKVVSIKRGPVVTLFEYQPNVDSKISKILSLEDDLALALQALSIRIIAPIPGRSVVGFEVANQKRKDVLFSSIVKSETFTDFTGHVPLILGKDTIGNDVIVDLSSMPHLLIAGSTGSGKSVSLNALLISMLCKLTPDELNLILVDPKRLEFSAYEDISHLLFPIVTDPKMVSPVLKWVVKHMEDRYEMMAQVGARNIFDYNNQSEEKLPFIVIVIDELADLMMTAGREIESLIARIAQMARAAGIHMIVATQRPSVDVITGLIKVNFPSRISFRVTSKVDSRTILDCCGAEKLLGRGDMLFLGPGSSSLKRLHGAYVSSREIDKVVTHIRKERDVQYHDLSQYMNKEDAQLSDADDALYQDVLDFLQSVDEVSISLLQRKFRIGYNRSARIIEMLESQGVILPSEGGKTRKVVR